MGAEKSELVAIILLALTVALIFNGVYYKMQERNRELDWKHDATKAINDLITTSNDLVTSADNANLAAQNMDHNGQVNNAEQNNRLTALEQEINGLPTYEHQGTCIVVKSPNATMYEMKCQTT